MDNVVNLAEYRKAKEDAELEKEVEYLKSLLDAIVDALPPVEYQPIAESLQSLTGSFLAPQTNLSGYYDDDTT